MKLPSVRTIDFFAFLACCILIASALFLEVYFKLVPCSLCIVQRIIIMLLGLLFLLGALVHWHAKKGQIIYHSIIFLVAVLGIVVAARHVWLEMLPPGAAPPCAPNLTYLLQMLPLTQALQLVFLGSNDCAKVSWRFLGLSLPTWTLFCFVFFALLALWQGWRKRI